MNARMHKSMVIACSLAALMCASCTSSMKPLNVFQRESKADNAATAAAKPALSPDEVPEAQSPEILPQTHMSAGRLHESNGHLSRAAEQYQQVIAMKPDDLEPYNRLGIVLDRLGRFKEADEVFNRAIQRFPREAGLRNNLAFSYIMQSRWREAETELNEALAIRPDFARARVNLGMALAQQERFEPAMAQFQAALPKEDAYYNIGLMYQSKRRNEDAARAFQKALEHNPKMLAAQKRLDMLPPEAVKAVKGSVAVTVSPAVTVSAAPVRAEKVNPSVRAEKINPSRPIALPWPDVPENLDPSTTIPPPARAEREVAETEKRSATTKPSLAAVSESPRSAETPLLELNDAPQQVPAVAVQASTRPAEQSPRLVKERSGELKLFGLGRKGARPVRNGATPSKSAGDGTTAPAAALPRHTAPVPAEAAKTQRDESPLCGPPIEISPAGSDPLLSHIEPVHPPFDSDADPELISRQSDPRELSGWRVRPEIKRSALVLWRSMAKPLRRLFGPPAYDAEALPDTVGSPYPPFGPPAPEYGSSSLYDYSSFSTN